jgi:hypothetical protein
MQHLHINISTQHPRATYTKQQRKGYTRISTYPTQHPHATYTNATYKRDTKKETETHLEVVNLLNKPLLILTNKFTITKPSKIRWICDLDTA